MTRLFFASILIFTLALGGCSSRDDVPGDAAADTAAGDGSVDAPPGDGSTDADPGDGSAPDGGTPDGSVPDGSVPDGSVPDGSAPDGSAPDGSVPDGGRPDSGRPDSGRPDAGGGACGELGKPCRGADECAAGFRCDDIHNACLPADRPSCGGFAGALCTTRAFPDCRFLVSSDFGPCLSTEEAICACRELTSIFACRSAL